MKRFLKAIARRAWRLTAPVRRPLVIKAEAFVARCVERTSGPRQSTEDVGLVLDHVIRELVRLQDQVDQLQFTLESKDAGSPELAVVRQSKAG